MVFTKDRFEILLYLMDSDKEWSHAPDMKQKRKIELTDQGLNKAFRELSNEYVEDENVGSARQPRYRYRMPKNDIERFKKIVKNLSIEQLIRVIKTKYYKSVLDNDSVILEYFNDELEKQGIPPLNDCNILSFKTALKYSPHALYFIFQPNDYGKTISEFKRDSDSSRQQIFDFFSLAIHKSVGPINGGRQKIVEKGLKNTLDKVHEDIDDIFEKISWSGLLENFMRQDKYMNYINVNSDFLDDMDILNEYNLENVEKAINKKKIKNEKSGFKLF